MLASVCLLEESRSTLQVWRIGQYRGLFVVNGLDYWVEFAYTAITILTGNSLKFPFVRGDIGWFVLLDVWRGARAVEVASPVQWTFFAIHVQASLQKSLHQLHDCEHNVFITFSVTWIMLFLYGVVCGNTGSSKFPNTINLKLLCVMVVFS